MTLLAALGSIGYLAAEEDDGELSRFQVRLYFTFFGLFASLMLAALETGNLGLLFVLVEASTLASAALVGLEGRARSLEAAWKYVIISSLGVTIALAARCSCSTPASALHLGSNLGLTWPYLFAHAHALAPQSLRLAFLLAVVGLRHQGRPGADAHLAARRARRGAQPGQRDAVGRAAQHRHVRDHPVPGHRPGPARRQPTRGPCCCPSGSPRSSIGALFMVRRGNFKRLFAYSSVEHMGIIAVALGFGGVLGLYGALLQTLNHALAKAVLFLSSGDVVAALPDQGGRGRSAGCSRRSR